MELLKIFVYGSLKPGEINYNYYCDGKVIEIIEANIRGKLFDLPLGYPAAVEGEGKIEGFLYTFHQLDILASIDELEGYQASRSLNENEYYRKVVPIYDSKDGFLTEAWTYFMTPEKVKQTGGIPLFSTYWSRETSQFFR